MATPPLSFLERRWASGSTNSLIKAATQTNERAQVATLDYDTHRNISAVGRRTLMSIGRFLYWNCLPIRASINEMARLSVSSYVPQFSGADKAWGKEAQAYLMDSNGFIDVRGAPFTWDVYLQNLVRETIIDGDLGTLLTQDQDENPRIQTWRAHRIACRDLVRVIQDGPFSGRTMIDGIVVNDFGRAIGYALIPDGGGWGEPFAYPSANDFILSYAPVTTDQVRGYSELGVAAFDWQDWREAKAFELINQKIAGQYAVEMQNETGQADRTKQLLQAPSLAPDSSGNALALPTEIVQPGKILYFKAGKNQGIKVVDNNRPSQNWLAFQNETIRAGLSSIGWSFDFSHNPTEIGGASMRVAVDKINSRLDELRNLTVYPTAKRVTGWRISKAIKNGLLRENNEWWKWYFQGPKKQTADRKYDSEIALEETARGLMTDEEAIGERGGDYNENYVQTEHETQLKAEAAKRLAAQFSVTIQEAYSWLWMPKTNGNVSGNQQKQPPKGAQQAEAP